MHTYLDAKLRSFGRFLLSFLRTWKFTRQLASGLGYLGAYLQRLLACFSGTISVYPLVPSRNWARAFGLYISLCVFFGFRVELECWTVVLNLSVGLKCWIIVRRAPQCWSARQVELIYVLGLLHWAVFSEEVRSCSIRWLLKSGFQVKKDEEPHHDELWVGSKKSVASHSLEKTKGWLFSRFGTS